MLHDPSKGTYEQQIVGLLFAYFYTERSASAKAFIWEQLCLLCDEFRDQFEPKPGE
jgi:hypothetical protein